MRRTVRLTVRHLLRGRRVAGRAASDGARRTGGGTPSAAASGHCKSRQELTKPHGAAPTHQRAGAHAGEGTAAAGRRAQRRGGRGPARQERGRPRRSQPRGRTASKHSAAEQHGVEGACGLCSSERSHMSSARLTWWLTVDAAGTTATARRSCRLTSRRRTEGGGANNSGGD